jgi:hypothetical protein
MSRSLACAAVVLMLFFSASLALTRAQSIDLTSAQRAVGAGPSCGESCMLGSRLIGITERQAVAFLHRSEWVGQVIDDEASNTMTWTWSGRQPDYIDPAFSGYARVDPFSGVMGVIVHTTVPLSHFWLAYGVPPTGSVTHIPEMSRLLHFNIYTTANFIAEAEISCPASIQDVGATSVILVWARPLVRGGYPRDDYQSQWRHSLSC